MNHGDHDVHDGAYLAAFAWVFVDWRFGPTERSWPAAVPVLVPALAGALFAILGTTPLHFVASVSMTALACAVSMSAGMRERQRLRTGGA